MESRKILTNFITICFCKVKFYDIYYTFNNNLIYFHFINFFPDTKRNTSLKQEFFEEIFRQNREIKIINRGLKD